MFGDIEKEFIENYKERLEVSENILHSSHGRHGSRYLDVVLRHLHGSVYVLNYRVRSKEKGSFIFDTFSEAATEYNKL